MDQLRVISQTLKTPFGPLTIVVNQDKPATVVGAGFGPGDDLMNRIQVTRPSLEVCTGKLTQEISQAVTSWLDGNHRAFAKLKFDQIGTDFRQECWAAMQKIKPGQTISYAQLAQQTSSPSAVRAAATACAQNLIAPLIPCHRIIKTGGSLGRYGYGESLKRKLLAFEGVYL